MNRGAEKQMKKIFALFLVMFALVPYLVACGTKPVDTNTNTDTDSGKQTDTATDTNKDTSSDLTDATESIEKIYSKDTILKNWEGKTLNVLATRWNTDSPSPPWSVIELCVSERDDNSGYGSSINNAILDRADYIKETYGVTINWIQTAPQGVPNMIANSLKDGQAGEMYHLAMPRILEVQNIVEAGVLYDMASSKYIDFSQSYYSQAMHEAYTVAGHTFFAGGDANFLDEMTCNMMYYNKTMGESFGLDLYQMVKDGTWTLEALISIAKGVGADDGDGEWTDKDTYGLSLGDPSMLFTTSGIQQVSVDADEGKFKVTMDDDRVGLVIDYILQIRKSTWARTEWKGGWYAPVSAFKEGRLLFLNEAVQQLDNFSDVTEIEIGVLPNPKLSDTQEDYVTTCTYMAVALCIPRTTDDREFSEYFVDVLSWTGQEMVMNKFYASMKTKLAQDKGASFEMLKNYIFDKIIYDNGKFYGYEGLFNQALGQSWSSGQNKFQEVYSDASIVALGFVKKWNKTWESYAYN